MDARTQGTLALGAATGKNALRACEAHNHDALGYVMSGRDACNPRVGFERLMSPSVVCAEKVIEALVR